MTLEPKLPEEARGDQFETATPVHLGVLGVEEDQEERSATPFDYNAIEIHTEETPTEEPSDAVTHPPDANVGVDTVSEISAILVPVFTEGDGVKSLKPGDEMSTGTTTITPYTLPVSSPAPSTASGPGFPGTSHPVTDGLSTCVDMEGSSTCGTDDEASVMPEGSAGDALPTPADSQSNVMTDETEIGGTEMTTFIPDIVSQETTTPSQTDDFEGSASGEDESSGQDIYPTEAPTFTSTRSPVYSTLHTQQPPPAAGVEVTEAPVVLPGAAVTESGSGAEQLSEQGEVSGEQGVPVDLPQEVGYSVFPDAEAVTFVNQSGPTAYTKDLASETSTPNSFTQPSFAATVDKKHPVVTTDRAPTSAGDHTPPATKPNTIQTNQSTTTSKPYVSQPTFVHSTHSVPHGALTSDLTATPLPEDVDEETVPPLLESKPQIPEDTPATKQPDTSTDYSVEANTVNIKGTQTTLFDICFPIVVNITAAYWFVNPQPTQII